MHIYLSCLCDYVATCRHCLCNVGACASDGPLVSGYSLRCIAFLSVVWGSLRVPNRGLQHNTVWYQEMHGKVSRGKVSICEGGANDTLSRHRENFTDNANIASCAAAVIGRTRRDSKRPCASSCIHTMPWSQRSAHRSMNSVSS